MKKITYKICAIVAAGITAVGCTSFLNVESIGKSTIETFFQDVTGLQAAGVGLHRELLEFYDDDFLFYADLAGDMVNLVAVNANEAETRIHNFNNRPEDNGGYVRNIWGGGYTVITNANNILYYGAKLRDLCPSETEQKIIDKVFGWAYFTRALVTLDLCHIYAQPYGFTADASHLGVPCVTTVYGFEDIVARSTVKECYDQAVEDLNTAYGLLGDEFTDPTYISGLACQALLARVYLYMGDYDNAEKYSKAVMDRITLTPRDEYVDMYRNAGKVAGSESILRMNNYDATSHMKSVTDPTVNYSMVPNDALLAMYPENDIRRELMTYIPEPTEKEFAGQTFTACTKYCAYKSITDEKARRVDPFVLRGSEMYLIHAEALCNRAAPDLAGAVADIKALEARARGISASSVNLPYSDAASVNALIEKERILELCFEGHRLLDILRRGQDLKRPDCTTSNTKIIKYPDYRFALPICQMEMQSNENMIQNDGYSVTE